MKRKGFKGILLLLSMLFALTGCSVSEATQHGMAVDTIQAEDVLLRVDFLNVGQADCALLSTNGHYMVIDGGNNGDADTILSYLEGQGVEKLDAVVGTHPHEDHIGSLDAIINHFDVDAVYMPKIMHTSKTFEDVLDAVANKGLKIKSPSPGDTIDFNGLEIEVLGPQREYKDFNNNSIVLKVNAGETAFLFTGDAEETAEKDILQADYDLQADVLKVGRHHWQQHLKQSGIFAGGKAEICRHQRRRRQQLSSPGGRSPAAAAKHWCRDLPYRFAGEYCLHHRREKYCLQL